MRRLTLADAAARYGIPEDDLRGAILLGELAADDSDDAETYVIDRAELHRYLIARGWRFLATPKPVGRGRARRWLKWIATTALLVFLLPCCGTFSAASYRCTQCGIYRHRTEFLTVVPLGSRVQESELSRLIRASDATPCRHRWVFAGRSTSIMLGCNVKFVRRPQFETADVLLVAASDMPPDLQADALRVARRALKAPDSRYDDPRAWDPLITAICRAKTPDEFRERLGAFEAFLARTGDSP